MTAQVRPAPESLAVEDAVQKTPQYCRQTLNLIPDGLFVFSADYSLSQFNDAAERIIETFCPGWANTPKPELTLETVFAPESFVGWADQIRKARQRRASWTLDNLLAVTSSSQRLYDVYGATVGTDLVLGLRDVTRQRKSIERLFHLEKLSEQGILASWVTHDLNNFLSLILGSSELAGLALNRGNTEKATTLLDRIKSNVSRVEQFNTDLIKSTRVEAEQRATDLNRLVTEVVAFASGQSLFRRVVVGSDLDEALPKIKVKTDEVAQLLLHLLNNAADAITETGRDLGHVRVTTSLDDESITLSVTDDGCGMPPDLTEKLFQRRCSTKDDNRGYSLVTCREIMNNHRASVEVESEEGQGSKFTISFPLADDQ